MGLGLGFFRVGQAARLSARCLCVPRGEVGTCRQDRLSHPWVEFKQGF